MNIIQALPDYLDYLTHERMLKRSTVTAYTGDLRRFDAWVGKPLQNINRDDLRSYMRHLSKEGAARATIRRKIQGMSTFFRWAALAGRIERPPTDNLTVPRRQRHAARFLSDDELRRLVQTPPPRYQNANPARDALAVRVLALLGLRRSELLGLKIEDVQLTAATITIRETKSGDDRVMKIPAALIADFEAVIAGRVSGFVFAGAGGGAWHPTKFNKMFKRHSTACGLAGVTPHTLRHTFATALMRQGVHVATLRELLGHKEIKTTMQYIHHHPEELAAALERHPLVRGG